MSTSSDGTKIFDSPFAKRLVMVAGAVPAVLLTWDAVHHQLGANEGNFAIRTTGLIGLVMLMLSLVITPLRKLTGWNLLIAVRRNLGVLGFVYILAHFFIFFLVDRAGSIGSTFREIVDRVYLWFGFGALLMMIPLTITSTDAMLTRLGAKRWKRLHRLAYPIAIAGVVHYYLLVKSDIRQPLAFAIALGVLLLYRVGARVVAPAQKPTRVRNFWSGELKVARIVDETHDVKTFRFVNPTGGPIPFTHIAGQYLNLALTIDGKRVNRSYTISSSPNQRAYCEISVKCASMGYGSVHLHGTLREGSLVKISAPAGKFFFAGAANDRQRVVLIAGGIGITPMMSVVRSLTERRWSGEIYLLFAVKAVHDIVFRDELAALQSKCSNLHVLITVTSDAETSWTGERGRITREMITAFVPTLERGPILLCGPDEMMAAMRALLVTIGIDNDEIQQEVFESPPMSVPSAAGQDVAKIGNAGPAKLEFQRSGTTVELAPELTVLEAAEDAGIEIPYECRSGICGQCKTKLLSGRVSMPVQDALTPSDRAAGLILACQAHAIGKIVVDA